MNRSLLVVMILFAHIISSCSDDSDVLFSKVNDVEIGVDSVSVSIQEAVNVGNATLLYPESRQGGYDVEIIFDAKGKPAIYVINYSNNGGFVLVSATKNYYPVLAYNKIGNYKIDGELPGALVLWREQVMDVISKSENLPIEEKRKHQKRWELYGEEDNASKEIEISRSNEENPEWYYDAQTIVMNKKSEFLAKPNCEVYEITGSITGDDALDEEIREYVKMYIYPVYEEYWDVFSFVVKDTSPDEYTNVPNFMDTKWDQGYWTHVPSETYYNYGFPLVNNEIALVGCGGLATAQVMRYYEYPSSFNWNDMPANSPTATTSAFLYDVAEACNSVYLSRETLTTQADCLSALQGYGYSANHANYSYNRVWEDVKNRKPVMMRANVAGQSVGHAWVVTGGSYSLYNDKYDVWTFNTSSDYRCAISYPDGQYNYNFLYMNWGWGGDSDGLYNINGLYIPRYGGDLENMTCIYNITPNN